MEGNIFNVVTIARLLEMPEEVLNQVTKSWEDDGGQLNLTLQHWSEKTGGVENLSSLRKCLEDINQEGQCSPAVGSKNCAFYDKRIKLGTRAAHIF